MLQEKLSQSGLRSNTNTCQNTIENVIYNAMMRRAIGLSTQNYLIRNMNKDTKKIIQKRQILGKAANQKIEIQS